MKVINIHEREIAAPLKEVGAALDALSSAEDRVWPSDKWPRIKLDGPLKVGAKGGHGPIRYMVESYSPGERIQFKFTGPRGFCGYHDLALEEIDDARCLVRHSVNANLTGLMVLKWKLVMRALHDALIEDALDNVEIQLSGKHIDRKYGRLISLGRQITKFIYA
ncbi:hypothetical protein [Alcanivorax sp. 1008]|uniref:hypothetical protein n=1 Tax=Alcanivorax sp. 1008 TaxID=2816853 RepID=UPI001DD12861|nr:hypothetical protein [Alcanivorax sp. 1008]MCC1495326.1 hypothetical protein [Alcanivorax sp. 1008]